MQKMPEFTGYLPEKYLFTRILGQFPALKLRVSGFDPQHQLRYHGGHRSTGAIVLNKLFMRHLTLLHSISLDA